MTAPSGNGKIYRIVSEHPNLTEKEIRAMFNAEWNGPAEERGHAFNMALRHLVRRGDIDRISRPRSNGTFAPTLYVLGERAQQRLAEHSGRETRPVRNVIT